MSGGQKMSMLQLAERAQSRGLRMFSAGELGGLLLLIDLDGPGDRQRFERALPALEEGLVRSSLETRSPGGEGWHVYLRMGRWLGAEARVGMQAILGSDPMREAPAMREALEGRLPVVVLFETQDEARRVDTWLAEQRAEVGEIPF